jgi:molybdopterin molybdotransferase
VVDVQQAPVIPAQAGIQRFDLTGLTPSRERKNQDTVVFGLPGNPVSSMVCFEQFVLPALRLMMGCARLHRRTISARLTHDVKHKHSRTEFVRVTLHQEGGAYAATSTGSQGSGILPSMAKADGLLVVPASSQGLVAGEQVMVQLLDGTSFQDVADFRE